MSSWEIGMWKRGGALTPHARLQSGLHWRHRKVDSRHHCPFFFPGAPVQLGDLLSAKLRGANFLRYNYPRVLQPNGAGGHDLFILVRPRFGRFPLIPSPPLWQRSENSSGKTQIWKEKRHFKNMGAWALTVEPWQIFSLCYRNPATHLSLYTTTGPFFRRNLF